MANPEKTMRRIATNHASNCYKPCVELPQSMHRIASNHGAIFFANTCVHISQSVVLCRPFHGLISCIVMLPIAPLRFSMGYYVSPTSWAHICAVSESHIVNVGAGRVLARIVSATIPRRCRGEPLWSPAPFRNRRI